MKNLEIERFVSTPEGAYDVIALLRGGAATYLPSERVRAYVSALAKTYGVYQTYSSLPKSLPLIRARKWQNKEWPRVKADLAYPKEPPLYGRCNRPKCPMLYCSLYEDAALAEIDAQAGDLFAISTFLLPTNFHFAPIGELDYFRRTGNTYIGEMTAEVSKCFEDAKGDKDWEISALLDAFLAEEFAKDATSQSDYKVTSAFSDILLNDLNPNTPLDGIVYPSVKFRNGLNFAICPQAYESKLKLIEAETHIVEIRKVVGFGLFNLRGVVTLKAIAPSGELLWSDPAPTVA